jgi:exonuclease SbcC
MILNKVILNPFGGLGSHELVLKPGLNVVLGPNEAGKSTYFNAIQKALLNLVKPRKGSPDWADMQRFLPLGGDTAHVELHFSCGNKSYTLVKKWGSTPMGELKMPDGAVISDDAAIAGRIRELLPVGEATCRTVLMAYQSGLARTLEEIKNDGMTLRTLSDILRSAMQATDGVSVDEFLNRLNKLHTDFFDRWDTAAEMPENNRGIQNPYTNRVGKILKAYYDKAKLEIDLSKAMEQEEQLDALNSQITDLQTQLTEMDDFIKKNRAVVESAQERRILEAQTAAVQSDMRTMRKDNEDWPVARANHARFLETMTVVDTRRGELQKEEIIAKAAEAGKVFRDRLDRAKPEKEKFENLKNNLHAIKTITTQDIDALRVAQQSVYNAETAVAAGKLTLELLAQKTLAVTVTKDLGLPADITLCAGDTQTLTAGGRLRLEHLDWSITVMSGEQTDITAAEQKLIELRATLENMLQKHGVSSFEEASEISQRYTEAINSLDEQRIKLEGILDGLTFDELKQKVDEYGGTAGSRPLVEVIKELSQVTNELVNTRRELEQVDKRIDELTMTYGDTDTLFLKVAEAARKQKELADKRMALAPLPAGVTDVESFVKEYQRSVEQYQEMQQEKSSLLVDRARLEGFAPEQSSEELRQLHIDAQAEFTRVRAQGQAIARAREVATRLAQSADATTFTGLEQDLVRFTSIMTSGKHSKVDMQDSLPTGFVRNDGQVIGYNLLSSGTKDVLALSLRLAIARYFLKDAKGFLMMDDPLASMDPKRQANAAQVLKEYAEHTQVVIFTCHPGHADLLGEDAVVRV